MPPTFQLIEGPYLRDLRRQPEAVWETTQTLAETTLADLPGRYRFGAFDRVVLTGMGTSLHALYAIAPTLCQSGLPVVTLETSELVHVQPQQLTHRTLLIAVSQSGASAETVRLLKSLPEGCHLLGITNTPASPLAEAAHTRILTQAGEEAAVACKTYLASVAALLWLIEVLGGAKPDAAAAQVGSAAEAIADYLSWWRDHTELIAQELSETRQLYITGRGSSLAAACAAGLTIKESARFPTEALSSAAFRHGPLEMAGPDTAVLVLEGTEALAPLNRSLHDDILRLKGNAWLVGRHAETSAFKLPSVGDSLLPLIEVLPLQLTSIALAALAGVEPGRFQKGSKVTTVE